MMTIRARYFDDFLKECVPPVSQVVLMAAGLDTRAYRLAWPAHSFVFEVDQPEVLAYKERILRDVPPGCNRSAVTADLTGEWADRLVAGGFDPSRASVWLLEGFLFYLTPANISRIVDAVTGLAAVGSRMGFDIINGAMLTSAWTRAWVDMQTAWGAPWIGTLEDPVGFLGERGWHASLTQAGEEDANYGRWRLPILPLLASDVPHDWFVTAEKLP